MKASSNSGITLHASALMLGLVACLAARAESTNSLKIELRVFTEEIAAQCSSVKEQAAALKAGEDPLTTYTLKDAVQSLCVCMPAQTRALMDTLSEEDLARDVTEVEFLSLLNPYAIDTCAAEQMHAMYGEQCQKRFKKAGLDVRKYCGCMSQVVSGYSNAVTAAIAAAASDYLPLAATAEKNGEPPPPRPPILEAYFQADQACKANPDATRPATP